MEVKNEKIHKEWVFCVFFLIAAEAGKGVKKVIKVSKYTSKMYAANLNDIYM